MRHFWQNISRGSPQHFEGGNAANAKISFIMLNSKEIVAATSESSRSASAVILAQAPHNKFSFLMREDKWTVYLR